MPFPSPNFGERRGGARPDLIVIHYTAMASCAAARDRLCDPAAEVSAHWLISEQGMVEQLVDEAARAWHAGAGAWGAVGDVNSRSIGIELANTGDAPFPEPQMRALERLLPQIMARWAIPPQRVIGHSDMAPGRKGDPGPRFDWRRLAVQGLAVWPRPGGDGARPLADSLTRIGYPEAAPEVRLAAFRMRFRPWAGGPEEEADRALAADLADRFGHGQGFGQGQGGR
ncbi:N-acetylmuramoyl-L-alanine amidase [Rhodobacter veldkampii DSM 11550]|uniref:N-acetylmuramoyl-L-alanine amidase n=1 Tax=Phaeovulum veldkampii DSM 11550 TaxID=1185920 RepID=A0A2T4JIL6_9RHOB|nr:N-acetylmuramoyl-L-alanine amidase [Phaeovulum veldkampii]MBK5947748.1 N-acetylmuramoyl-L-alanine amidase [Phaeovulum veldkampii DSM 11550]PTE17712.1 N-acetylmuramoyl-L-alanine amidase [Phaeovulum veldkampii DSM 11550]TDQ58220.1 N-acetylmuramoyl-L-alanine amidase [Phaeovulum veldkampii DSM 11550]